MARCCCPIDIDVGTFEEVIGPDEDEPHYVISTWQVSGRIVRVAKDCRDAMQEMREAGWRAVGK